MGLYHCPTCKGKVVRGLINDPTFDEDLWDFVISGMHRAKDPLEKGRVEQAALNCCIHSGELCILHCNRWVILPSMRRRKGLV